MSITILRPGQIAERLGHVRLAPPRKPDDALWAMLERTFDELRRRPDQQAGLRHWLAGELADMKAELLVAGTDLSPAEIAAAAEVSAEVAP